VTNSILDKLHEYHLYLPDDQVRFRNQWNISELGEHEFTDKGLILRGASIQHKMALLPQFLYTVELSTPINAKYDTPIAVLLTPFEDVNKFGSKGINMRFFNEPESFEYRMSTGDKSKVRNTVMLDDQILRCVVYRKKNDLLVFSNRNAHPFFVDKWRPEAVGEPAYFRLSNGHEGSDAGELIIKRIAVHKPNSQ